MAAEVTKKLSIMIPESSVTFPENIYSTGITHDNHLITIVTMFIVQTTAVKRLAKCKVCGKCVNKCHPFLIGWTVITSKEGSTSKAAPFQKEEERRKSMINCKVDPKLLHQNNNSDGK